MTSLVDELRVAIFVENILGIFNQMLKTNALKYQPNRASFKVSTIFKIVNSTTLSGGIRIPKWDLVK